MAALIAMNTKETIEEKRKRCLLGELPEDFLRLPAQNQTLNYNFPLVQPQYVKMKQLEMTIVQARLAKNYGITRMDPYCKVRVGHKTYETVTAFNGSKSPYWNKKFLCPIPKGVEAVQISIFDEKTMSADEEIAFAIIPFPEEIFKGNIVDKWYSLSGRQGDNQEGQINIVLSMKNVQVMQAPVYQPNVVSGGYVMQQPMVAAGYPVPVAGVGQHPQLPPVAVGNGQISPQPVKVSDSDIDQLHEMFPSIEKAVIRAVLEEKSGNKEACIGALLTLGDEVDKVE